MSRSCWSSVPSAMAPRVRTRSTSRPMTRRSFVLAVVSTALFLCQPVRSFRCGDYGRAVEAELPDKQRASFKPDAATYYQAFTNPIAEWTKALEDPEYKERAIIHPERVVKHFVKDTHAAQAV